MFEKQLFFFNKKKEYSFRYQWFDQNFFNRNLLYFNLCQFG